MARLELPLPDAFPFSTEFTVRITDINYGGHLANDRVLSLVHEARLRFLSHYGFSEIDIGGVGLIMTDAAIVYKAQGFYGEVLKAEVAVTDLTRTGCDFVFRLTSREGGKEVARAKTGIVFFDYKAKKVVAVPEVFLKAIGRA
jgi:acyl-CoA thioesterase FadM